MCSIIDCKERARYKFINETELYCPTHKHPGMIDVSNKKCIYPGCVTRPCYNLIGEKKGILCNKHKGNGMVDVANKRCPSIGCKKGRMYNYEGEMRLYCTNHKLEGMINLVGIKKNRTIKKPYTHVVL